jgi:hypothetical protein
MRLFAMRCGILIVLLFFASPARAVYQIVEIEKPFHSRILAGVTLGPDGAPLPGVLIEEFDSDFKNVLRTTTSDEAGCFSFTSAKREGIHNLSFRARGFNPLRIHVGLRRFASKSLRIKLPIGG